MLLTNTVDYKFVKFKDDDEKHIFIYPLLIWYHN